MRIAGISQGFQPASLTVKVGTNVVWYNSSGTHTVTSTDGSGELNSGNIAGGRFFSHEFGSAGTYPYRCEIHPSMTGTITVQP